MNSQSPASDVYKVLVAERGAENMSGNADIAQSHAGDSSAAAKERPSLVVFPRTPAQAATALAILNRFGQKAVIQGGLTGLAGAATPQQGKSRCRWQS